MNIENESREQQLAWAAGFFEGEGCIKKDKCYQVLSINNTDKDVMERFISIVGYGNLNGPYKSGGKSHKPHYKLCWYWQVGKKSEVRRILLLFMRYFGKRRTQRAYEALNHLL